MKNTNLFLFSAVLLALAMALPQIAFAATAITNVTELQNMKNDLTADYYLSNDIDASATSGWNSDGAGGYYGFEPVGNNTTKYTGTFDGKGYKITGLYINRTSTDHVGLFGAETGSEIKNVGLENADISGDDKVGALVGLINSGTITNSYSTGSVSGAASVGGLVGYNTLSSTITNSYSTVSVSSTGQGVGGLAGYSYGSTITNSYSTGSVSSTSSYVGGLTGRNYNSSTITNSHSTSSVSGASYVGGLTGYNNASTITNSYSAGSVSGTGQAGGLIGATWGGVTVTSSYWDTETSGQATSYGGTGKTTALMKTQSTFTDGGWNFTTIWEMIGYNYPRLKNNPDSALPVELSGFTAISERGAVILRWTTESEIENLGFILERRIMNIEQGMSNAEGWKEIASYKTHEELQGQGSVSHKTEYSFTDMKVQPGMTYEYRLADVSYGGVVEYHGIREVTVKGTDELALTKGFALRSIYPNPFNPETNISYAIGEEAEVNLVIVDLLGKEVKQLLSNKVRSAGNYIVKWDGISDNGFRMSSGVYFVVMKSKGVVDTQKMVLFR